MMNNTIEFENFVNDNDFLIEMDTQAVGCCCWRQVFKTTIEVRMKNSKMLHSYYGYGFSEQAANNEAVVNALVYLKLRKTVTAELVHL